MRTNTRLEPRKPVALLLVTLVALSPLIGMGQQHDLAAPDPAPGWDVGEVTPIPDGDPAWLPENARTDMQGGAPLHRKPAPIGGGIWLAQGPGPALFGQVEMILPGPDEVAGAIHTVAAHPTNPDILYAGGANGGIWRTLDATAPSPFWVPLTDSKPSLSIGALEFDPTDPSHLTLTAGIGRYSAFAQFGGVRTGNLLQTTDGGMTWATLPGFIGAISPTGISGVAPRGMTIVATANTSDAFACADIGIWRSIDGGASFGTITPPAGPKGIAFDLAGDPGSPGTLYTALTFVPLCTGSGLTNGVYKSVDTGLTWAKVSNTAMDALIIDGTTNNVEIAFRGLSVFVNIIQSGRPVGIFHSPDGGVSWAAMDLPRTPEGLPSPINLVTPGAPVNVDTTPIAHGFFGLAEEVEIAGVFTPAIDGVWTTSLTGPASFDLVGSSDFTAWSGLGTWVKVVGMSPKEKAGSQGSIHASIAVDPAVPTSVFVGGDRQDVPFPNFLGASDYSGRLFRGNAAIPPTGTIPSPQWEHLTHSSGVIAIPGGGTISGSAPHADSREMVFDANENLIETDDGGIYRRTNPWTNAGDWFSINGNIQVTEQHDVAYDSLSNIIMSGNQDTGTTQQFVPNGLTWDSVSTADGGDVAVDDLTSAVLSTRFSSFQNLAAFRRREYDPTNTLISEVFPTLTPTGTSLIATFVTPVELNAMNPTSLLIVGCNAVFESFDQGDNITNIPGALVDPGCGSGGIIQFPQNAVAYGTPVDADVIWIGAGSQVYNRFLPAPAALAVTPTSFPGGTVTDVVIDPTASTTAYVSDATDVYQTHDAGTTWTKMTGNLTDTRIGSLAIDPSGYRLFVGGREGVSTIPLPVPGVAASGPFVWGLLGTGLPNAPVWDMEWDDTDGVLVVGTLGRGSWLLQENGTCGKPDKLVVNNQKVAGMQLNEACTELQGGPALEVLASGNLEFKAPTVKLGDMIVRRGAKFVVDIGVP